MTTRWQELTTSVFQYFVSLYDLWRNLQETLKIMSDWLLLCTLVTTHKFSSPNFFITYRTQPSAIGFLYLSPRKLNVSLPAHTFLDVLSASVLKVLYSSASHVKCNDEMTGFIKAAVQVGRESMKQNIMIICIWLNVSFVKHLYSWLANMHSALSSVSYCIIAY